MAFCLHYGGFHNRGGGVRCQRLHRILIEISLLQSRMHVWHDCAICCTINASCLEELTVIQEEN